MNNSFLFNEERQQSYSDMMRDVDQFTNEKDACAYLKKKKKELSNHKNKKPEYILTIRTKETILVSLDYL